ncbi:MAG: aminotransferase class III-fold pyridoxal phosphate-dependent enzyme [Phycisphaerales bacterium]|nr:aminotransferase class III-fold pyridoxal phosphate-dependent enzyme [Phycisphaerales bacterium]
MKLFDVYALQEIELSSANGAYLYDQHHQRYLDFYGGHAVISIGHNHPHWQERIQTQMDKISFYSNSVILPIQKELAEKLGPISQKEDYALFLCNSGAEANENALKLASFHNGRSKVVAFSKSFHGRTSLAVSVTDNPTIVAPVNKNHQIIFLPFNDEEALASCFEKEGGHIAAVIIEGIQGVGGIRVATTSFLRLIRSLCTKHQSIYIADSVQCGYGRSGDFFSHDYAGVAADIYSVAKGMGNGFPVAGILIHPMFKPKIGMLGTTFGGNPLACAAALAVLEVIEQEQLLDHVKKIGTVLQQSLQTIPAISNTLRGRGLMIGFDVPPNIPDLKKTLLDNYKIFVGDAKPNTIRLLPALNISHHEIGLLTDALTNIYNTH